MRDQEYQPHTFALKICLFSFFFFAIPFSLMANGDTLHNNLTSKEPANVIELELLAENYISPFNHFLIDYYRVSPFSLFYSRNFYNKNIPLEFRVGMGVLRTAYTDLVGNNYIHYSNIIPDLTIGIMWKTSMKKNGFLLGFSCNWALGRQDYEYTNNPRSSIEKTIRNDYQLMPDFCYQFRSRSKKFTVRLFYTPKISSGVFKNNDGYEWVVLPIWGGVSIGGGW